MKFLIRFRLQTEYSIKRNGTYFIFITKVFSRYANRVFRKIFLIYICRLLAFTLLEDFAQKWYANP